MRDVAQLPETLPHHAFICFAEEDTEPALRLEAALKHTAPGGGRHRGAIHLEEHSLARSSYGDLLDRQVQASGKLIVVCTPAAVEDPLVNRRIREFARHRGAENIIPVLLLPPDHPPAQQRAESPASLPEALQELFPDGSPPAAILPSEALPETPADPSWIDFLSRVYDLSPREMAAHLDRLHRRRRLRRRLQLAAGAVMALLVVGAFLWVRHREALATQRELARQEARRLVLRSEDALAHHRDLLALHLLAAALERAGDDDTLRHRLLTRLAPLLPQYRLEYTLYFPRGVTGAAVDPEADRLLAWSRAPEAQIRELSTGQVTASLRHPAGIRGARFTPDGKQVLTWGIDGTARLWDVRTGRPTGTVFDHGAPLLGTRWIGAATRLLTWGESEAARLWDAASGRLLREFVHRGWVYGVVFNREETLLLTWCSDSTAHLWDVTTGRRRGKPLREKGIINGAAFSPDERWMLTWGSDGIVRLRSAATGKAVAPPMRHDGAVLGAVFNREGTRLLTWSDDHTARVWAIPSGDPVGAPLRHEDWVLGAAWGPNGASILTWSYDNTVRIWPIGRSAAASSGGEEASPRILSHGSGHSGGAAGIYGVGFSSGGNLLWSRGADNTVRLWNFATGEQLGAALAHPRGWGARHRIIGVEWVPETSQMVTWSSDSTLKVWQVFSPPSPDPSASAPAIDFDLPAELIPLEVMALTGTVYNPETHTVEELPPDRWRVIRERYRKAGEKHFRKCRYPASNRWASAFGG